MLRRFRLPSSVLRSYAWILLASAALYAGSFSSTVNLRTMNGVLLMCVAALGLNLIMGLGGLVSVASAALMGTGAFVAGVSADSWGLGFVPGIAIASVVGIGIGTLLALPALRLQGLYLAAASLGIHFIILAVLETYQLEVLKSPIYFGESTVGGFTLRTALDWYMLLSGLVILLMFTSELIRRSRLGRHLHAIKDDPIAAEAFGVNTFGVKLVAFAMSSSIVSLAGALQGYYLGSASYENYSLQVAVVLLAAVIVGGMRYSVGPLLGSLMLFGVPIWITPYITRGNYGSELFLLRDVVAGAMVAAMMISAPDGVAGVGVAALQRIRQLPVLVRFKARPVGDGSRLRGTRSAPKATDA